MKLFNSLGRELQEFKSITPNEVKLYTCGPTVYDYSHIGNLRAYVFDDTLRRILTNAGYNVKHVMNITDVGHLVSDDDQGDDKLEKGALREQKTVSEVADFYIKAFENDISLLNILEPNAYKGPHGKYARATDFIDQQIEIVKLLFEKDIAYRTKQAIYFNTSKLPDYGKLTEQKLDDKEVAARAEVVSDDQKENPQDFALWFFTVERFANHSLHWNSPWGEGFPGWHLECSAIIHATLGEPIDIHTGGVDHIGTHHTNEIAQSEAAFDVKLANYWLHNEHLLVNGRKMSKSLGNYYRLQDVIDKDIEPLALRLLFLQSHYRTQTNFTWDSLEASAKFLKRIQSWSDLSFQIDSSIQKASLNDIEDALRDDLNTPLALSRLSSIISDKNNTPDHEFLVKLDAVLGLELSNRLDLSDEDKKLIVDRTRARKNQDWSESDKIRDLLLEKSIELNDSQDRTIWSRV